jgi:segregation and condensation protein B
MDEKNQVEALLFSSGKFMTEENLSLLIGADIKDIRKALKTLKEDYEKRETSIMLVSENDSWKINVREKYLELVRKIVADTELPKSVLETLAVIAWKSPVTQAEVVNTRGNKAYEHIAQLEEMGFVNKEKSGRSFKLKLSEKFFEYFDVQGTKDIKEILKNVKIPKPDEQKTLAAEETQIPENVEMPELPGVSLADQIEQLDKDEDALEQTSDEEIPMPTAKSDKENEETSPENDEIPKPEDTSEHDDASVDEKIDSSEEEMPESELFKENNAAEDEETTEEVPPPPTKKDTKKTALKKKKQAADIDKDIPLFDDASNVEQQDVMQEQKPAKDAETIEEELEVVEELDKEIKAMDGKPKKSSALPPKKVKKVEPRTSSKTSSKKQVKIPKAKKPIPKPAQANRKTVKPVKKKGKK